jgi:hypothetical protein
MTIKRTTILYNVIYCSDDFANKSTMLFSSFSLLFSFRINKTQKRINM